jgi:hypothetical protein
MAAGEVPQTEEICVSRHWGCQLDVLILHIKFLHLSVG